MSRLTKELHGQVERLLSLNWPMTQIAAEVGLCRRTVAKVANGGYAPEYFDTVESRSERAGRVLAGWKPQGGDPTPVEIAEACGLLRAASDEAAREALSNGGVS